MRACFSSSGQLCISVERMYVADAVYDRFVPAISSTDFALRDTRLDSALDFLAICHA